MFHPRFVIDDDILIICCQHINLRFQNSVNVTVTTGSLAATHNQQVITISFSNCLI